MREKELKNKLAENPPVKKGLVKCTDGDSTVRDAMATRMQSDDRCIVSKHISKASKTMHAWHFMRYGCRNK